MNEDSHYTHNEHTLSISCGDCGRFINPGDRFLQWKTPKIFIPVCLKCSIKISTCVVHKYECEAVIEEIKRLRDITQA